MLFKDLKLIDPLLRAVHAEGYTEPTPIQVQAIPHVLQGRDLLGCAQTGTGKTAAFALPTLQRLVEHPQSGKRVIRVLVLSPTRELASQIGDSFDVYGKNTPIRQTTVFGGVGQQPQVKAIQAGVDVLVATPGRLLDLMQQGYVRLDKLEIFILDEADRMLDMGFIHDVRKVIAALPKQRQTLMFSATMPPDIQDLANNILVNPTKVEVTPQATTVEKIDQSIYFVEKKDKRALLEHLLGQRSITRVLVFTRTKHGANKVVKQLDDARINAEAIHGNKSQTARERALANFKSGVTRVLVATDIAARGIDVDGISHVINYDLPNEPESYVHRIGRTARAGASGIAFSFCEEEERPYLVDIERLIRMHVPRVADHPYSSPLGAPPLTDLDGRGPKSRPNLGSINSRRGQGQSQSRSQNSSRSSSQSRSSSSGQPRRDSSRSDNAGSGNGSSQRNTSRPTASSSNSSSYSNSTRSSASSSSSSSSNNASNAYSDRSTSSYSSDTETDRDENRATNPNRRRRNRNRNRNRSNSPVRE
jgi:ATP-dependent RNA helicase RhlE